MDKGSQSSADDTNTERRGIFSTPELTVDTEKIAESTAAATEASRAKIASIFANTETGRQSQRLNDAMVANSRPATEDIVINNGPKKKRKWPLVVAVVILLAAVGGVVTWAISYKNEPNAYASMRDSFLAYANFMLQGESSTESLDDSCVTNDDCHLLKAMQEKSRWNDFVAGSTEVKNKLAETFKVWENSLEPSGEDDADADEIARRMQRLLDAHEFMSVYFSRDGFKKSDIVNYYLQNGEAGIQDYIANYYGSDSDNTYLKELRASTIAMGEAVLENINIYAQHNCMTGFMNEACFVTNSTDEEKAAVARNNQVIADYGLETGAYATMPYDFVNDILEVNDLFNLNEQTEQK